MRVPDPQRPSLSGYVQHGKLLPWQWVDAHMDSARSYWITTHSPKFPSSRAVWGIWKSPVLWFSSGSTIARNIIKDSRVQVHLESADEVVIIEGAAQPLAQSDALQWANLYNDKYNWDMPETNEDVWEVRPARILAWLCDSSGLDYGAGFSNSATEWIFTSS